MLTKKELTPLVAAVLLLLVGASVHGAGNINKNVSIDAGSESRGHSTVNGSISVGNDAIVNGALETVNGTIRIDDNARIMNAKTVNGPVRIGSGVSARDVGSVNGAVSVADDATIDGAISVVNGKISLGRGASVLSDVSNVNGEMDINGAAVGGDLRTVNGDVRLHAQASIAGDLVIERPNDLRLNTMRRKPRVEIGPGSRVQGEIRLEREVELYISDSAEIGGVSGVMSLEDAVRFSGERP